MSSSTPPAGPADHPSLLRRYLPDRRFLLTLPRAVTLQLLHPAIAASYGEHVHTGVWAHKQRTVNRMIGLARTGHPDPARVIRLAHEHVKGRDHVGNRYHALTPELFHFQHATYVDTLVTAIDTYARPLTPASREYLYQECCAWYRSYGISTRPLPGSWPEFTEYFAEALATELHRTEAAARLAEQSLNPPWWAFGFIPGFAARAVQHERAVELLGLTERPGDRLKFTVFAAGLRAGSRAHPRPTAAPAAVPRRLQSS
ncbi:oxygenase MpaB family protein [Nocardia carnea]|uniref:oxygenase MpaB family protein n=1 Tax=Nocardia carnea TaxID=37328 RepID=UPI0024589F0C|nr:oxygenase MpaB family protein [Nocardia carnea]